MIRNKIECKVCSKLISKSNISRHEAICQGLPIKKVRGLDYDPNIGYRTGKRVGKNQYTKAKELGLPPPTASIETRKKLSIIAKKRNLNESDFTRKKRKETIRKKIKDGEWHVSLAKNMHHKYKGVNLHGSWELKYAKYLDINNIPWERCTTIFNYNFEGKERQYTPDFFLPNTNEYVEIKGYATVKDRSKWDQFPKELKLTILQLKDLKELEII